MKINECKGYKEFQRFCEDNNLKFEDDRFNNIHIDFGHLFALWEIIRNKAIDDLVEKYIKIIKIKNIDEWDCDEHIEFINDLAKELKK